MSTDPEDTDALGYGDRQDPESNEEAAGDPDAGPASTPDEVEDKDQAEG